MVSLSLEFVSKHFGKTAVLSEIDMHVPDGEFCVLLGPSGCGKSTLLNIIAGLIPQDSGLVKFDGEPVDNLSPRDRNVAMVFQNYALYPHMTVAKNMGFGLRMHGLSEGVIRERIDETALLLEIKDLLDRKPKELSGGQRQRVAMGRALVRRPNVFLLDEPLSNLDARLREEVRLELKNLHRRVKGTAIYVTHDQVEAMTLGDRVAIMKHGKIHQIDIPEIIYNRPADNFVATFIGSPQMNLFSGTIRFDKNLPCFDGKGFSLYLDDLEATLPEGEIQLGVRPEDLFICREGENQLEVEVDMTSNIGSDIYIHAGIGRESITLRAPKGSRFRPGDKIALKLEPKHLHFFKKGTRV